MSPQLTPNKYKNPPNGLSFKTDSKTVVSTGSECKQSVLCLLANKSIELMINNLNVYSLLIYGLGATVREGGEKRWSGGVRVSENTSPVNASIAVKFVEI